MTKESIIYKLNELRLDNKLTQKELSKQINMCERTLQRIFNFECEANLKNILKIADSLGCELVLKPKTDEGHLFNFVESLELNSYSDFTELKKVVKAFDIIKHKSVDINLLKRVDNVNDYNYNLNNFAGWLVIDEFKLLKEVLK